MKIIIGLGTSEKQSSFNQYHIGQNIGLLIVDYLAETYDIVITTEPSLNVLAGIGDIMGQKVVLVKSVTNTFGTIIKQCTEHFGVSYEDILVIYDDIHMPFDKILFKYTGDAGGHYRVQDIISTIGTDVFPRLQYGVGECIKDIVLSDCLHSDIVKIDLNLIHDRLPYLRIPIEMFVWRGIVPVMNAFN